MKKQVLIRCVFGAAVGLTINVLITILISAFIGDGQFYAVPPMLIEDCGGELNAVVIQAVCSMIYGAAWSAADLIWTDKNSRTTIEMHDDSARPAFVGDVEHMDAYDIVFLGGGSD